MRVRWIVFTFLALTACGGSAAAQTAPEALLCTGYSPEASAAWHPLGNPMLERPATCPPRQAVIAGAYGDADHALEAAVFGWCCPLPADALLEEHQPAELSCPEGFVVTGLVAGSDKRSRLRCTRINHERYRLGRTAETIWVRPNGAFTALTLDGVLTILGLRPSRAVNWGSIPAGLRYGIGRVGQHSWIKFACASYPWGSPMVGITDQRKCPYVHRTLEYLSGERSGERPEGTAATVPLVAPCLAVDEIGSTRPRCVTAESSSP